VLCLSIPVVALVPYLPLVRSASAYSANYWSKPSLVTLFNSYGAHLDPIRVSALFLLLAWLFLHPDTRTVSPAGDPPPAVPPHEKAVLVGFVLYPVAAFVLGRIVKGYVPRYALPSVTGTAALVGLVAARYTNRLAGIALALALWVIPCWDALGAIRTYVATANAPVWEPPPMLREAPADLPIVVADPLAYHQLTYYADASLARRLVFVHDAEGAAPKQGDSSFRSLRGIAKRVPLAVLGYDELTSGAKRFLVLQSSTYVQPLSRLLAEGASVRLLTATQGQTLYLVALPER
jgi:hypothetical protein